MSSPDIIFYSLIVLGAFAMIFMVLNDLNGIRDFMKMNYYAKIAKQTTSRHGNLQMYFFGMMTMLAEGDSMRASSAILGFTNGRVITQPESTLAMISSAAWKALWIWVAGFLVLFSITYTQGWTIFAIIGLLLVILNISSSVNLIGRFLLYIGVLLFAVYIAGQALSSLVIIPGTGQIISYINEPEAVGLIISAFAGVFVGASFSGNLLGVFIAILFVLNGISCPECAITFAVGNEVGTLFPMSFMVSETNLPARKSFICYSIAVVVTWILDIVLLLLLPFGFLSNLGAFGFVLEYTCIYSLLLPIVYYIAGTKIWEKVGAGTHEQLSSKVHLYQFDQMYRPHVSLMLIQAEKEIVNLHYRIHKMLDFIIDMLDGENEESSLEHVKKYKEIVYRTGNEITDFIIAQTSAKTNAYVSELAKERLQAVSFQCQLGTLFCDMAEVINQIPKDDYQIIRRCVVSLETFFNLSTKLIDNRYNIENSDNKILLEDVELLNSQLDSLINEYGKNTVTEVLPYALEKSKAVIVKIIESLK